MHHRDWRSLEIQTKWCESTSTAVIILSRINKLLQLGSCEIQAFVKCLLNGIQDQLLELTASLPAFIP